MTTQFKAKKATIKARTGLMNPEQLDYEVVLIGVEISSKDERSINNFLSNLVSAATVYGVTGLLRKRKEQDTTQESEQETTVHAGTGLLRKRKEQDTTQKPEQEEEQSTEKEQFNYFDNETEETVDDIPY